uniref:Uncharacterized protein OJ1540_H01.6 n=1 Tax=Oryza sativa TaxID=4530 RepID=Q8SB41_ORYSA|nr:hypothetical protein [Oryza sativa Japonica Group]
MDSLSSLFVKVEELGLLQPLGIPHWVSLYADDVVAFVRPTVADLEAATTVPRIFGEASGLHTNFNKCSALPISSIPIYLLIALDAPKWVIKGIDKIRRGFLWAGKVSTHGGKCRVAWGGVCAPKCYGGLGVPDLDRMGIALRSRWVWLQRTSPDKPWHGLNIPVSLNERNFATASTVCVLGNGESILFWEDIWLEGSSIRCIAPAVWAAVPARLRRRRTVAEALQDRRWIRDCTGALGLQAILEYLQLWSILRSSVRLSDHPDSFIWKWEASGVYSSRSAYRALFLGRVPFQSEPIWKTFAPPPRDAGSLPGWSQKGATRRRTACVLGGCLTRIDVSFVINMKRLLITSWSLAQSLANFDGLSFPALVYRSVSP